MTDNAKVITFTFMKRLYLLLGFVSLFFMFFSCNANINIDLKIDSSGQADVDVKLHPLFLQYIVDLTGTFVNIPEGGMDQPIDVSKLKEQLEKSNTVSLISMDSAELEWVNLKLGFNPLEEVLDEGNRLIETNVKDGITQVMNMTVSDEGVKKVTFHLDRENFFSLAAVIPSEVQPLISSFAPPPPGTSREDALNYLKINFDAYEDQISDEDLDKLFLESKFTMNVTFAGELVSYSGGTFNDGVLTVEVALFDLLYLADPFVFEIEFK